MLLAATGAASASDGAGDPGEIEGDWLNLGFVEEIARTRQSPHERNRGVWPEALQFKRPGGALSLRITDFHEARDARIRNLDRDADGRWRIAAEGERRRFDFDVQPGAAGGRRLLTGPIWHAKVLQSFVHLPEGIAAFVNAATVAGT